MVSINNTASNSFVLASLRQTDKDLATAQTRIGTGLKVNSASDNASVFSIAQGIRTDIKTQSSLTSSISVAKAKTDAAVAGLNQVTTLIGKIKDLADNAGTLTSTAVVSTGTLNQIKSLQTQITAVIAASGFQGENYLSGAAASKVVKIGSDASATITLATDKVDATTTGLGALATAIAGLSATSTNADIAGLSTASTTASDYVGGYQATLSTFSSGLESQVDFLKTLDGIKQSALSSLVDANMEEESAKVTSLQVKQQLAYQALAITNSSSQNILRLFQ